MFLFYCSFPVPLQWPAQRPFIENIIFCWINGDGALIMYLFNIPDWDPTVTWVIIRFKSCSGYGQRVNMIWKRLIGVQIYILDGAYDWAWDSSLLSCRVGKRCLLCAGFTDPPKPSGWYRKYIGNRTIEGMSANQKILTSLYLIKLTGHYWFYNWFVRSCDFEGRNLNLNITFADPNRLIEPIEVSWKKRHSDYRCWHSQIH